MAEIQPPHFLQEGCHTALGDRQVHSSIVCEEGVAFGASNGGDLAVSDGASGLQVVVASGNAFIQGDSVGWQGIYHVSNDGNVTLTLAAADPTDPRIDIIIAQVKDSTYSGPDDEWELMVVTGSPSPSPSAPAVPASALVLAQVAVAAGATTLSASDITDRRVGYGLCTSAGSVPDQVVFTTDGTFEKADYPGLRYVEFWIQGGGGGGGASDSTAAGEAAAGSGGAGGSCAHGTVGVTALSAAELVDVAVAALGGVASNGADGASSSFAGVVAPGGGGGLFGTASADDFVVRGVNGTAVAPSGDTFWIAGGSSAPALTSADNTGTYSSSGGDAQFGSGGRGRVTGGAGEDGNGYGSGGGGAKSAPSTAVDEVGGDGAPGIVVLRLHY